MKSGDLIKKLSIFSLVVVSSLVIAIQAMENEVEENRKQKKELDFKFLMAHKISCSEKRSTQLSDIRAEGAVVALFFRNHQEEHMEDYRAITLLLRRTESELLLNQISRASKDCGVIPRSLFFSSDSDTESDSD